MTDQRTADGADLRERIERYLDETGMASDKPRVVPLTGEIVYVGLEPFKGFHHHRLTRLALWL